MILAYAITDRPGTPLPAPLAEVTDGGLAGVYAPNAAPPPSSAALWRHERMLERLMEERTVLPMRFGTELADERELSEVLRERRAEFASALEAVRGKVELALRVAPAAAPPEDVDGPSTGRAYIERKLREAKRRAAALEAVRGPLEALAAASRVPDDRWHDGDARASYLVERSRVEEFGSLVRELDGSHPELHVLCTGPWPPYSFVR